MLLHFVAIRRFLIEISRRTHFLFSLVGTLALWRHLSFKRFVSRFFVIAGFCFWGALPIVSQLVRIWHNFSLRMNMGRVTVTPMADASLLTVVISRRLPFSPEQYVNLWIPYVSIWPHGHRLTIAWWEENQSTLTLFFLAEDQPGFCRRIREYGTVDNSSPPRKPPFGLPFSRNMMTPTQSSSSLFALFNGPYGLQNDFSKYGTVVAFASGAGIAPVMAHVKALVDENLNFNVCTRRIALYWQIEKEGNQLSTDSPSIC
jgi:hypothetical protein